MLKLFRSRTAAAVSHTSFCDACSQVCTPQCRAEARREASRTQVLAWLPR